MWSERKKRKIKRQMIAIAFIPTVNEMISELKIILENIENEITEINAHTLLFRFQREELQRLKFSKKQLTKTIKKHETTL